MVVVCGHGWSDVDQRRQYLAVPAERQLELFISFLERLVEIVPVQQLVGFSAVDVTRV